MTNKSITSGFPKDLREAYRLLLRYPLVWFPIVGAIFCFGMWVNGVVSNLNKNDSVFLSQDEAKKIRIDERERCDEIMQDYKELVIKLTPKEVKNEK